MGTEKPRVRVSTAHFFTRHTFTAPCAETGAEVKVADKTDSASDLMGLSLADAGINLRVIQMYNCSYNVRLEAVMLVLRGPVTGVNDPGRRSGDVMAELEYIIVVFHMKKELHM